MELRVDISISKVWVERGEIMANVKVSTGDGSPKYHKINVSAMEQVVK